MCYQIIASNYNTSLLTHSTDVIDGNIENKETIKYSSIRATIFDK